MSPAVVISLCILGVAALALFVLLQREQRRGAVLRVERDALAGRIADREADVARMGPAFEALSARALKSSNEEFLKLAGEHLEVRRAQANADLDQRRSAVDKAVAPIAELLKRAEEQIGRVAQGNAGLAARMRDMLDANRGLQQETGRLTQALRKPNVRGRYGEIQLERVVELAGMRRWCDFGVQENLHDDDKRLLKPDMVVRLPGGRVIAIDAKTSIDSYLDAVDEADETRREALLERYAANVAEQVAKLGRKEYWSQLEALEMVVMFVPGDQLIDAALERRPDLVEIAAAQNVVMASPSTLIGLLRAVHVGWRERELSDSAEELFRLGRELHERAAIALEHASRVGDAIRQTTKRYNEFVGSVDNRLVPTLKKFEERGARSGKTLGELRELEEGTRRIQSLEDQDVLIPAPRKPGEPVVRAADAADPAG
jgi:DNA recombination protein RmuC